MKAKKKKLIKLQQQMLYVESLRKRLASENYQANKTKAKYKKAKLKLKMLKEKK